MLPIKKLLNLVYKRIYEKMVYNYIIVKLTYWTKGLNSS